jgi:decaprenyl-phosphate phosphoribosyltransferase
MLQKISNYLRIARITHWTKNLVIFAPIFFGQQLFVLDSLTSTIIVFFMFSLTASAIYVFNDIKDLKEDQSHPEKKHRPLAAGKINFNEAYFIIIFCLVGAGLMLMLLNNMLVIAALLSFIFINIVYTTITKHLALLDIFSIGLIYLVRLIAGAIASSVVLSGWLSLTIFFGALIMIIGKRYSEIRTSKVRKVMKQYSAEFLRNMFIISIAITIAFFAIYSISTHTYQIPSLIIFTFIMFRYYFLTETSSKAEKPHSLLFTDIQILTALLIFAAYNFFLIY